LCCAQVVGKGVSSPRPANGIQAVAARGRLPEWSEALEVIYYTVAAIVLYLVADRVIDTAERAAGRRFEYRTVYFFALLSALAVGSFYIIRHLTA